MDNVIEFKNVWKKFRKGEKFNSLRDTIPNFFRNLFSKGNGKDVLEDREFWVTKDVSFDVKKGEVVGIIGPNGAGKSTILKMLSGILAPNKGAMQINGRLSALIEVTAGFHPELTGRENIYLNGTILGMKKSELDDRFEEIVEFSGIKEFIDTPIKRYSSGMLSRLGFSVAAHVDPDVLLVDEVLAVGDISFQSKCAQKMRELLKSGVTIVIVSHNLGLIQSLCSRVILLNKGEIIKEGSSDDVIPYYENIVFKQKEEEVRQKLNATEYKVKVNDSSPLLIKDIQIFNGAKESSTEFNVGSEVQIKIDYEAKERIESPVFAIDIARSDGVLCCESNTKDAGLVTGDIEGKGSIIVSMGKINLAPGIYLPKVGVWDKDMIHPYDFKRKDVLRINMDGSRKQSNAVFVPSFSWKNLTYNHVA